MAYNIWNVVLYIYRKRLGNIHDYIQTEVHFYQT